MLPPMGKIISGVGVTEFDVTVDQRVRSVHLGVPAHGSEGLGDLEGLVSELDLEVQRASKGLDVAA